MMTTVVRVIEFISEWSGRLTSWFCLALVSIVAFEVFMRYVLGRPTIWSYETSTMFGATIYAMGLAYTYLHDGHVRVDVFWRLLPQRGRAIADVIGSLLFFFPLMIIIAYVSAQFMGFSISAGEKLAVTNFHPPAWPIRAVILLGVLLFFLQGVAKLIRDLHLIRRNESL